MNKHNILEAYLEAALWSTVGDDGDPLSDNHDISDCHEDFVMGSKKDIDGFIELAGDLLNNMRDDQIGHDFWLTRNRHGAGFWDRGLGDKGKKLTNIAHSFGSVDPYVDYEGKIRC